MTSEAYKKWLKAYNAKRKRTPLGFLRRQYDIIKYRVSGKVKHTAYIYKDLPLCDRETFLNWAIKHPSFKKLFKTWLQNDCPNKLRPTVDRINPRQGYILTNMDWVSWSENTSRSNKTRHGYNI